MCVCVWYSMVLSCSRLASHVLALLRGDAFHVTLVGHRSFRNSSCWPNEARSLQCEVGSGGERLCASGALQRAHCGAGDSVVVLGR